MSTDFGTDESRNTLTRVAYISVVRRKQKLARRNPADGLKSNATMMTDGSRSRIQFTVPEISEKKSFFHGFSGIIRKNPILVSSASGFPSERQKTSIISISIEANAPFMFHCAFANSPPSTDSAIYVTEVFVRIP